MKALKDLTQVQEVISLEEQFDASLGEVAAGLLHTMIESNLILLSVTPKSFPEVNA